MSEVLPRLDERQDPKWDRKLDRKRIKEVKQWVLPLLADVMVAQTLGGGIENDDEFSEQVDRMYAGLRARLTRQDLLTAFLESLEGEATRRAAGILNTHRDDVEKLTKGPL